jgi:hypothetical protein
MRDLADSLIDQGLASKESIIGCTPDQVSEFRRARGIAVLPAQYEEFLTVMGREAGDLLRGTDFFYPTITEVGNWGQEILAENKVEHLFAPGSLVLGTHQGYIVYWMEPGEPSGPVRTYMEGKETVTQTWPSLLDFLVDEQARVRKILGK